jgi:hypothetical protein
MLIICNGMPRSASTWTYNVAMALLRETGLRVHGGYGDRLVEFLKSAPAADHIVVKTPFLTPVGRTLARTGAARVIYSWRDPADAIGSAMAVFDKPFEELLAAMDASLELRAFHHSTGNAVILAYQRIIGDPRTVIREIAAYLALPMTGEALDCIETATSLRQMQRAAQRLSALDPSTLLFPKHIRDGRAGSGRALLSSAQLARVEEMVLRHRNPVQ